MYPRAALRRHPRSPPPADERWERDVGRARLPGGRLPRERASTPAAVPFGTIFGRAPGVGHPRPLACADNTRSGRARPRPASDRLRPRRTA